MSYELLCATLAPNEEGGNVPSSLEIAVELGLSPIVNSLLLAETSLLDLGNLLRIAVRNSHGDLVDLFLDKAQRETRPFERRLASGKSNIWTR
jgi:hypothetical protein